MLDIKEVWHDFQKMNKVDCILIHLKNNDQRIHITSAVSSCTFIQKHYRCKLVQKQ